MILIIVMLVVALLLLLASVFLFMGMPESRTVSGKRLKWILAGTGVFIVAAMGLSVAIMVQESTGMEIGLSGGPESDARQWISRNRIDPPAPNQPGDNIRILREGIAFLSANPSVANTPQGKDIQARYGVLPARPTRLLTRQEESQYYEGARAVYQLISRVAGENMETVPVE